MRGALSLETYSRKRLAAAGLLLVAGLCLLALFSFSLSKDDLALPMVAVAAVWFGVLTILRPPLALSAYAIIAVTTMPYQFFMLRGQSTAGGIYLSQVLLVVMFVGWFMRTAVMWRREERRTPLPLLWPLVALAIVPFVSILSAYVTWDPEISTVHRKLVVQLAGASLITLATVAVFLVYGVITTVSQVRTIFTIMVALSALSFCDAFNLFNLSTPGKALVFSVAPIAFSFALHERSWWKKLLWLSLVAPPLIMSVRVIKVTLIVEMLVPLLFISLAHSRRTFVKTLAGLLACYALLGVAIGHSPGLKVYEKAQMMKDFDRIMLLQKAVETWKAHPLFGVGPGGQFAYLDGEHFYGTAHSLYGNLLMEIGLVGMVVFFWVAGAAIRLGLKSYRHTLAGGKRGADPPDRAFVRAFTLGQTGGLVGVLAAGLFSDTLLPAVQNGGMYMFGAVVYIWMLLGMTAALQRMQLEGKID